MSPEKVFESDLIAPCGLNCGICQAYLRTNKKCSGCRGGPENKSNSCLACKIKNCLVFKKGLKFCYFCTKYPCANLEHLAIRYQTRYSIDLYQNFKDIKEKGLENFVREEIMKWTCAKCGGIISMHKGCCSACGEKNL